MWLDTLTDLINDWQWFIRVSAAAGSESPAQEFIAIVTVAPKLTLTNYLTNNTATLFGPWVHEMSNEYDTECPVKDQCSVSACA